MICSNDRIAYCDAAPTWNEDTFAKDHDGNISDGYDIAKHVLEPESMRYSGKVYNVELKSLFYAFHLRTFTLTALRSLLIFYLPLLEPRAALEDDDEDFLADKSEEKPVDLVTPFHKSVKQTVREVCSIRLILFHQVQLVEVDIKIIIYARLDFLSHS